MIDELKNQKTVTVTKSLDAGPCFKSKPFLDFTDKYKITHVLTSAYNPTSNGQAERAIQEAKKMMEKLGNFNPYHIAFALNKMERRGNLGTPMDLFLQRPSRGLSPNSQNIFLRLAENEAEWKKKAMKAASPKNKHFNQDQFKDGDWVVIQDHITKKWMKTGTITSSRPTNTGQGARSFTITTDDGKSYLRNSCFLARPAGSEEQADREESS